MLLTTKVVNVSEEAKITVELYDKQQEDKLCKDGDMRIVEIDGVEVLQYFSKPVEIPGVQIVTGDVAGWNNDLNNNSFIKTIGNFILKEYDKGTILRILNSDPIHAGE